MGISINGPSGIDTASLISQLTELEMQKVYSIQNQRKSVSKQLDAYSQFDTFLNDVSSAATKVDDREDFNMFNSSSSNADAVTISTSVGAQDGNYGVKVFQLAEREKLISKDGLITDSQTKLSDLGVTPGTFKINDVEITLDSEDSLEELRAKINSAKKDDGSSLGVTATVLKMADDNYRFVLTSDDTGSEGATYEDVTGESLQKLGIIKDAAGDKGLRKEKYTSSTNVRDSFGALLTDDKIAINGTDSNGDEVSVNYVKGDGDTISDFTKFVESAFNGAVSATVDAATGKLSIEDKNVGNSLFTVSTFEIDGVGGVGAPTVDTFDSTATGYKGANVLSTGKDAYFSVDNINMVSDTNKASGFVKGVNFELKAVSHDKPVTVSIDRDFSGIATKVDALINSYNAISRYVDTSTKYGDSEEGEKSGALVGDLTAKSIDSKLRSVFAESFDITGSNTYTSLAQIGVKTNTTTGRYELDRTKFQEALEDNFDEIVSIFVTEGYTNNSSVVFGTKSDDTQEGVYDLVEAADGTYTLSLQEGGDTAAYTASRQSDVLIFSDGPAKGMYLTAKAGSGDATVTFSKGLAGRLTELVDSMTESETGTLATRKTSMNRRISSYRDMEDAMKRRVDAYSNRLVKEFAAMEQTMSLLQSQSTAMMNQLGYTGS